jgi:hypothetical protein
VKIKIKGEKIKKILLVLMLLSVSSTVLNAGKLEVAKTIWNYIKKHPYTSGITAYLIGSDIVSAAGYLDDEDNSASKEINEAIKKCKHTYKFKFCTAQNGNEIAVAHSVRQCINGNTPRNGITIDLSKLKDSSCREK